MKCKYKDFWNERLCQVVDGECQFIKRGYGPECPVYRAFVDWDAYWISAAASSNGGVAPVGEAMTADSYDASAKAAECGVLNLVFC